MTKKAIAFIVLGVILVLAGGGIIIKIIFFSPENAVSAIQVSASPKADLYINNEKVGQTPYSNEKMSPGDYTVKLSTQIADKTLNWTGKVRLTPDTLTYINRELSDTENTSGGEILFLEKLSGNDRIELSVATDPIGATITVNSKEKGVGPLTITDLGAGDHELTISSLGYRDRIIHPKLLAGYRLNVVAQLSKDTSVTGTTLPTSATPTPNPSPTTPASTTSATVMDKPYIIVKQTPTGWLRVRELPSTGATESGKVNPNEKFPLLAEQTGWVKIKLPSGDGWVSSSYVQIVK